MKSHVFCASEASTAVCLRMDHINKNPAVVVDGERGGRAIDRHNPIIRDGRRSFATPCSSVDVPNHPPYRQLQRTKTPYSGEDVSNRRLQKSRRSFSGGGGGAAALFKLIADDISFARRRSFSCARPAGGFIKTPPGSSRYLLGDDPESLSGSSDLNPVLSKTDTFESKRGSHVLEDNKNDSDSASVSEKKASPDQVVVLRVSLHCKGCEEKVRKHLSRMKGVTSFSIDFAAKKVTVTGDVTPQEVLSTISKVKNAQFWTPPPPPPQQQVLLHKW